MTDYLTTEDLMTIATGVMGNRVHVGDVGLLASAAARPQASAGGEDAYRSLQLKAAALLSSLVRNHALVDGNKRLGWAATVVFCEMNGMDLAPPSQDAFFDLVMSIADGSLTDVGTVADVLQSWMIALS